MKASTQILNQIIELKKQAMEKEQLIDKYYNEGHNEIAEGFETDHEMLMFAIEQLLKALNVVKLCKSPDVDVD